MYLELCCSYSATVFIALKLSLVLGLSEEIGLLIYGLRNLQGVIMAVLLWRLLGHHALVYSMDLLAAYTVSDSHRNTEKVIYRSGISVLKRNMDLILTGEKATNEKIILEDRPVGGWM